MADLEQAKETLVRVVEEVWNQADPSLIEDLFSREYELHDPYQGSLQGPGGAEDNIAFYKTAFPDLVVEIDDLIGQGDRVVMRWHASGTHLGALPETQPTGKWVTFSGMTLSRFDNEGKIAEEWSLVDMYGLLKQLDALVEPEEYEVPIGQPAGDEPVEEEESPPPM